MKKITFLLSLICCFLWADAQPSTSRCNANFRMGQNNNNIVVHAVNATMGQRTLWSFGDGSGANTPRATHTYTAPGTYRVCLIVRDTSCSDTVCKPVRISPPPSGCDANFRMAVNNNNIYVAATNARATQRTIWSFGDGSFARTPRASHTYSSPGTYRVCLIVRDSTCADTVCKPVRIAPPVRCRATFGFRVDSNNNGRVLFHNTSVGGTQYRWSFGDGSGSTSSQSFVPHIYSQSGVYTVCLAIYNPTTGCRDRVCHRVAVRNTPPPPPPPACSADFGFLVVNDTVVFSDSSVNATHWYWNFGDGNNSTQQNPVHVYGQAGIYNVCLYIRDTVNNCRSRACKRVAVRPTPPPPLPSCHAAFGYAISATGTVQFSDSSTVSPTNWHWNFGDGSGSNQQNPQHTYSQSGVYTVCLIIADTVNQCRDRVCRRIRVRVPSSSGSRLAPAAIANLGVYPNPVNSELTLALEMKEATAIQVVMTNTVGQHVYNKQEKINEGVYQQAIDVSNLENGIYFLKVMTPEGGMITKRIIVQH